MSENLILPYASLDQALLQVRGIGPLIPNFEFAPPDGMRRLFLGSSRLTFEQIEQVCVAIESNPVLTAMAGEKTVAEIRTEMAVQQVMQSLDKEIDLHGRGARYTLGKRRRALDLKVMRLYRVAKSLNLPNDEAFFLPQIPEVERSRRRKPAGSAEKPVILAPDGTPASKPAAGGAK